ncbi:hypothetical protein [Rhodococcus sp. T7]|uniref:hypothetical protein n=1 Tax=Rhodococcus sp. T7 TaxID=627444 RepID=UPI0013C7AF40|nr:hypothetical protein [Rhodococcus sp. T7]KAF0957223.1 hypothetical protein MLGJGCBP_09053 [Rhodococcus sp. T7]KAF0966827.1 hypothetical protein MLGJGCBP_00022 [Rhodococcus sp. T7]
MAWDPETTDSQDWAERGLRLAADTTAGTWIVEHVHNFDHTVAALVPPVFPAYARIFHPATTLDDEPVRWAAVAAANGTIAHPVMEWGSIVGSWHTSEQEGLWHDAPVTGSLPARTTRALADILRRFTSTPELCWFAHWEGSGFLTVPSNYSWLPMPNRRMALFSGGIDLADIRFGANKWFPDGMSPHLWWPDDRAWCVATDIDLMTTYVGASRDCVNAVVAAGDLEALPVTPDQRVTWDSDTINPLPSSPSGRWPTRKS